MKWFKRSKPWQKVFTESGKAGMKTAILGDLEVDVLCIIEVKEKNNGEYIYKSYIKTLTGTVYPIELDFLFKDYPDAKEIAKKYNLK